MAPGLTGLLSIFAGRRIKRAPWWTALIGVALVGQWGTSAVSRGVFGQPGGSAGLILVWLLGSALIYASWLRFQDRGRPGWLALAWPLAVALDGLFARLSGQSALLGGSLMICVLAWLIIDLGLMPGEAGSNRFGPEPGTPDRPRDGPQELASPG